MIGSFLLSFVFCSEGIDIRQHPTLHASTVDASKIDSLIKSFGNYTVLLGVCLDIFRKEDREVFETVVTTWEETFTKYPIRFDVTSSQGYSKSSPCEFFYALCCMFVGNKAGFLKEFESFYKKIPSEKPISASFLLVAALMEDYLSEILKETIQFCEKKEDSILFFADFYSQLKQKHPTSKIVQYIEAGDDGTGSGDETEESRRKRESFLIAHLQNLMCPGTPPTAHCL